MKNIKIILTVIVIGLLSSCMNKMAVDSSTLLAYEYSSDLNARVLEIIKSEPLDLTVRVNEGSRIETSPKTYLGEEHGYLWWKHRWQEQTRFTIFIRPRDIGGQSVLEVYSETFHRKNSNFSWEVFDTPKNEKRATDIMNHIQSELGGNNVS